MRMTSFAANRRIGPTCSLSDDRTIVMGEDSGSLHFSRLAGAATGCLRSNATQRAI
jgi:hypothetical protein